MSSAKASHTAGRLVSEPSEPGRRSPVDAEPDSYIVATEHGALVGSIYNDRGDGAEVAARLAACWNALVGVADPEGAVRGVLDAGEALRDRMLNCTDYDNDTVNAFLGMFDDELHDALSALRGEEASDE